MDVKCHGRRLSGSLPHFDKPGASDRGGRGRRSWPWSSFHIRRPPASCIPALCKNGRPSSWDQQAWAWRHGLGEVVVYRQSNLFQAAVDMLVLMSYGLAAECVGIIHWMPRCVLPDHSGHRFMNLSGLGR